MASSSSPPGPHSPLSRHLPRHPLKSSTDITHPLPHIQNNNADSIWDLVNLEPDRITTPERATADGSNSADLQRDDKGYVLFEGRRAPSDSQLQVIRNASGPSTTHEPAEVWQALCRRALQRLNEFIKPGVERQWLEHQHEPDSLVRQAQALADTCSRQNDQLDKFMKSDDRISDLSKQQFRNSKKALFDVLKDATFWRQLGFDPLQSFGQHKDLPPAPYIPTTAELQKAEIRTSKVSDPVVVALAQRAVAHLRALETCSPNTEEVRNVSARLNGYLQVMQSHEQSSSRRKTAKKELRDNLAAPWWEREYGFDPFGPFTLTERKCATPMTKRQLSPSSQPGPSEQKRRNTLSPRREHPESSANSMGKEYQHHPDELLSLRQSRVYGLLDSFLRRKWKA